ncbi:tautomerase family protein [Nocardia crassostreae]|uniref:tautomerase family protein n=1 Tax=Nocardia crassostreae TaxID=53428 RepID=UPI000834C906|nr:tautomerase family protein [Nocardia crassostreae]
MPHVEISHFPADLSADAKQLLEVAITAAVTRAFGVAEGAVSIGLEGIARDDWQERVYRPLITGRADGAALLRAPNY